MNSLAKGACYTKMDCKDCGLELQIPQDAVAGEIVSCADCGAEFEITNSGDLKPAERVGEDWGQ
jgi:alpha-aminoadipate carrier protein LysW